MKAQSTMNSRMSRVFTALAAGFVAIMGFLTWWQILDAGSLRQANSNNQTAYYDQRVQRGFISTTDGVRLAGRGASRGVNGDTIWKRRYPQGELASAVLGYDTRGHSRAGVERAMNDVLTGSTRNIGAVVGLLDGSETAVGDNVTLTVNARAQRTAQDALAGKRGAVVALDPATGAVLAMASSPTYAPADVLANFGRVSRAAGSPMVNRATQGLYAPGSTFKLVTTAAALADGATPSTTYPGGSGYRTVGGTISNFAGERAPDPVTLTDSLTHSYNSTFAAIGVQLGDQKLRQQMEQFGFFSAPPLEGLPASEVQTSGLRDGTKLLDAGANFDEARTAIGQDKLSVTPLQMALVTAAIANNGIVPKPTVIAKVTDTHGKLVERGRREPWKRAMDSTVARQLGDMMQDVVKLGTGQRAQLPGITVAGKTGTAEAGAANDTWFVAFAPTDHPKVAIAVVVENQTGSGGEIAAPIAHDVLASILQPRGSGA